MRNVFIDSFLYGPLELDPHVDKEDIDFDADDVLLSTQLCDIVNDPGAGDHEVEEVDVDVSGKSKNDNVERVDEDPKLINDQR